MDNRVAVIDLGSNTTRMIVMAYHPQHHYRLVDEISENVRLAEGMGATRILQPRPIARAVETMRMFGTFCRSTGVRTIVAVGTSAVREAANQSELLLQIKAEAGIDLRVLSSEEEAYYGYLGVANSVLLTDGFVVDIGGGSTQVTRVADRRFVRMFGQQAGVVRFTERFIHSDPISTRDFRALEQGVHRAFATLDWLPDAPGGTLAGIGGTVRNLARVDQKTRNYPLERLHGYVLTRERLEAIIASLRVKTQRERETMPGLNRDRADLILAGAVILRQVMRQGGFESLMVSGNGLREGLFFEHFLGASTPLLADMRRFSILNLARIYDYEQRHAERVQALSLALFDQLTPVHGYGAFERELLEYAALLHDVGVTVGYYDHHKHSYYLITNAALLGFQHREVAILALLARFHRKGDVDPGELAPVLAAGDDMRVARLAALLRLAEYLERSKAQVVENLRVRLEDGVARIEVVAGGDATIEVWEATRRAGLFRKAFGLEPVFVHQHPG